MDGGLCINRAVIITAIFIHYTCVVMGGQDSFKTAGRSEAEIYKTFSFTAPRLFCTVYRLLLDRS